MLRRLVAVVAVALLAWPAGPASAQAGRDLYIKGLEHLDAKRWTEAIQAFDAALQADSKENKGARLYGMRYGYFPYRDKGVALYNLGRYDEAVAALEESLRQGVTPEATRYVDLARNRTPAVAVTQVFRGTWWDYYERGVKYSDAGAWKAAIQDFRAARQQRDKEDRSARTYGVAFIEYFPLRELGVALYQDGQYKAAVEALEKSLAGYPTAKGAYFYNLSRAALLRQAAVDTTPPRIKIDAPADGLLTNALTMEVRGTAESKNQVAPGRGQRRGAADRCRRRQPALHAARAPGARHERDRGTGQGPARSGDQGRRQRRGGPRGPGGGHRSRGAGRRADPARGHGVRQRPPRAAASSTGRRRRSARAPRASSPPTWRAPRRRSRSKPPTRSATSRVCGSRFPPSCVRVATAPSRRSCRWRGGGRSCRPSCAPRPWPSRWRRSRPRSSRILSPSPGSSRPATR